MNELKEFLTVFIVFPSVFIFGIYLSAKNKWPQFRGFKKLLKYSPMFRDVHKYSGQHFESEFKKYVDDYLKTVKMFTMINKYLS